MDISKLSPEQRCLKQYEYLRRNLPSGAPDSPDEMSMELSAWNRAAEYILRLSYLSQVPIAVVGGFALRLRGYEERAIASLEILSTKEAIGRLTARGALEKSTEALRSRNDNGQDFYFQTRQKNRTIDIKFVALDQFEGKNGLDHGIIQRSVFVMDHRNVPITRCATASDLFRLRLHELKNKGQNSVDAVQDLKWLAKYKAGELSEEQLSEVKKL